jgi:hypothetical protein
VEVCNADILIHLDVLRGLANRAVEDCVSRLQCHALVVTIHETDKRLNGFCGVLAGQPLYIISDARAASGVVCSTLLF